MEILTIEELTETQENLKRFLGEFEHNLTPTEKISIIKTCDTLKMVVSIYNNYCFKGEGVWKPF